MFGNTKFETCCIFCEIKDDCEGVCYKVSSFTDGEEVLGYCDKVGVNG